MQRTDETAPGRTSARRSPERAPRAARPGASRVQPGGASAPARPAGPSAPLRRPAITAKTLAIGLVAGIAVGAAWIGQRAPAPEPEHASLLVAFLTGLLTGGLTCLAVQGGLLATAMAQRASAPAAGSGALAGQGAPIALFLAAKLVAYTGLGALLGWFGAFVGPTPALQGWLQVAIGLFMLGVAAQLLDLHPVFRYLSLQPPRVVQRLLRQEAKSGGLVTPAVLGALTVLIPCGTTQAMMVAAIGTGDPVGGALLMFAFVLGTAPLFFTLGYFATQLGALVRGLFLKAAAVTVAVMACFSVATGLALAGVPVGQVWETAVSPSPAAPPSPAIGATTTWPSATAPDPEATAGTPADLQEVVIRAEPTAYVPSRVQVRAGSPARIRVEVGSMLGCTSSFTIPSLGVRKFIPPRGAVTIDIPTDTPRRIPFTCGMGMYGGVIEVVA